MAISNITTSTSGMNSVDVAISFTHTVTGTPRGIVVMTVSDNDIIPATAVTYGGTSLTEVAGAPSDKTTGEDSSVSCWLLGNNTTLSGNQTVVATFDFATERVVYCVTVDADGDISLEDLQAVVNDSLANPSGTLTLNGNSCFCLQAGHTGQVTGTAVAPLTNWTEISEVTMTSEGAYGHVYDIVGTSDVTYGATIVADDVNLMAVAFSEAAVGGGAASLIGSNLINSGTGR